MNRNRSRASAAMLQDARVAGVATVVSGSQPAPAP
jgi:hypothetical protein